MRIYMIVIVNDLLGNILFQNKKIKRLRIRRYIREQSNKPAHELARMATRGEGTRRDVGCCPTC
jgi:hypothetical protein